MNFRQGFCTLVLFIITPLGIFGRRSVLPGQQHSSVTNRTVYNRARRQAGVCYSSTSCSGDIIPATSERECCVGTDNGLSFSSGGVCIRCIGVLLSFSLYNYHSLTTFCSLFSVHGFTRARYQVVEGERVDVSFQLNVKGTSQFESSLNIRGEVTASADGTASKNDVILPHNSLVLFFNTIGFSDFESFLSQTISITRFTNRAEIRLFSIDDHITLEYDDRVLLTFTPANPDFIPSLEGFGEYMRHTVTIDIIDNDSK